MIQTLDKEMESFPVAVDLQNKWFRDIVEATFNTHNAIDNVVLNVLIKNVSCSLGKLTD